MLPLQQLRKEKRIMKAHVKKIIGGAALVVRAITVSFQLPSSVVLLACFAVAGLAAIASVRLWPNRLLGTKGLWWLERILNALPRRYARLTARITGTPYKPRAAATS